MATGEADQLIADRARAPFSLVGHERHSPRRRHARACARPAAAVKVGRRPPRRGYLARARIKGAREWGKVNGWMTARAITGCPKCTSYHSLRRNIPVAI